MPRGPSLVEQQKGYVAITQVVSPDTREKMILLCKERKISMKLLVQKLCEWAAENYENPVHLIRCGVNIPIWAKDREFLGTGDSLYSNKEE